MERSPSSPSGVARPPAQPLKPSDPRRLGRHQILGRLGSGGMGVVYLGEGPLGRIAVKVVRSDLADDSEFRIRFQREVQSSFRLSGRATARLVDFDLTGERPWFATDFLDAPDLTTLIDAEGPLDVDAQVALARGLVEGLVALHEAELVHRDLKPSNVLCTADGPKLIDFGISAVVGASPLTGTGQLLGTPAWMAPEQISEGRTSPASDVFSWAGVVAFAATGRAPFGEGTPSAVAIRVLTTEPDLELARVAPVLRPLLQRALARDPAARPHVLELQAALAPRPQDGGAPSTIVAAGPQTWIPENRTDDRTGARTGDTTGAGTERLERNAPDASTSGLPVQRSATPAPPGALPETRFSDGPPPEAPDRRRGRRVALLAGLLTVALLAAAVVLLRGGGNSPDREPAGEGTVAGAVPEPGDVAFAQDVVYVTDGNAIKSLRNGTASTLTSGGRPVSLDSAPNGLFYVDAAQQRVRNVLFSGAPGPVDIPLEDASDEPRHVVDASAAFVYVLDGGKVTRYDLAGQKATVVAGGGSRREGDALAVDLTQAVGIEAFVRNGTEEIYLLEPGALRRLVDGQVETVRTFTTDTDGSGGFVLLPDDLRLFLPDRDSSQIVAVDGNGSTAVVAGADPDGGTTGAPGAAGTVELGELRGINFAPGGIVLSHRPPDSRPRVSRIDLTNGALTEVPLG